MKTPTKEERRNLIGNIAIESGGWKDCLGIALVSYFERHEDRPEDDVCDEERAGWSKWALEKSNEALDLIADSVWPENK